ncbi:MAG TPA: hypothetical protein VFG87_06530 [Amycolatopsis sp.]|nr:hypothetical protein [Amycolatopsis sp.]
MNKPSEARDAVTPVDLEAPGADVAEQQRQVSEDPEPPAAATSGLRWDADPADVTEQQRTVTDLDDEFP